MFAEFFNNKILLTLTIIYIILICLAYYFNSKSWMQYKGDEKYSVEQELDDQDDEQRSTRTRWSSLFVKNKLFFYIIFATLGFISLLFAWLHRVIIHNKPTNSIPRNYFGDLLKFISLTLVIVGLFSLMFFTFSYAPKVLVIIINILNFLIILGVLAFIFEKTSRNEALLAVSIIFAIIGGLIGGLYLAFFGSILGAILGYFMGVKLNKENKPNIKSKFIISLLNFIPCIFIYLAEFIKNQFNITTKSVWILLFIEIILIIIRLLVPFLFKYVNNKTKGNKLITKPVSLHYESNLGTYISKLDEEQRDLKKGYFNYNYGVSFWLWIMPESISANQAYSNSTPILNIGDVVKFNLNNNKIEIFAATSGNNKSKRKMVKIFVVDEINYQRWNYYVINYSGGTLDIFKNGKLISSTPNITPISSTKLGTAGSNNGIYGGIKNVIYYKNPLKNEEINFNYKLVNYL